MKRIAAASALLLVMAMLLFYPSAAINYSFTGLSLWFERMVPTLFPFMMLSQILICFDLIPLFLTLFRPILSKLFPLPDAGLYAILTGFLCGFPMGAKTVAELHRRGQLSLPQAQTLLNFCNQIGPVYFISFAYPILQQLCPSLRLSTALFAMYGVPLCFGVWEVSRLNHSLSGKSSVNELVSAQSTASRESNFDSIVTKNLLSLSRLAGNMMFFPIFLVLLEGFPKTLQQTPFYLGFKMLLYLFLELTGGLTFLSSKLSMTAAAWQLSPKLLVIICIGALQLGGLSCLFQTQSMIQETALSLRSYLAARIKMTLWCVIFCGVSFFCW